MNHPLRYAGETFFQASFKRGDEGTVLQVVRNPGWLIPYISCAAISLGLLIHFTMVLTKFLSRTLPTVSLPTSTVFVGQRRAAVVRQRADSRLRRRSVCTALILLSLGKPPRRLRRSTSMPSAACQLVTKVGSCRSTRWRE